MDTFTGFSWLRPEPFNSNMIPQVLWGCGICWWDHMSKGFCQTISNTAAVHAVSSFDVGFSMLIPSHVMPTQVTAYALETAQDRGQMFVRPGGQVYEGQVVGIYNKSGDLKINVCKAKALTNMRASQSEKKVSTLDPLLTSSGSLFLRSLHTAGAELAGNSSCSFK